MLFLLVVFTAIFLGQRWHFRKRLKKLQLASNSLRDYCDLFKKVLDMLDDPDTKPEEWHEILPVCEYAENLVKETCRRVSLAKLSEDLTLVMTVEKILA